MGTFADIRKVFDNDNQRNIDYLSSIYNDPIYLFSLIKDLFESNINDDVIFNNRILLKPNWVRHSLNIADSICLCTNENFLLAALEVVLIKKPKSVILGDAPLQGCDWEKMLSKEFYEKVEKLSIKHTIPIKIKDFRRVIYSPEFKNLIEEKNHFSDYLIFDLGKDSNLEPISSKKNIFRVTNYNPDRLAESHRIGVHKYCITKELFYADVVITIPKIKTHQKTGLTNSMKILVGLNGDKDYLPHHRRGGTKDGGYCYPGTNFLRKMSESILDEANRKIGLKQYNYLTKLSALVWKLSRPKDEHSRAAGWYGNDTVWRMVFDLNRIVIYGKIDGTLSDIPQREVYSLCDGVIGGQGNGPLNPEPLALGLISFSNNAELMDVAIGYLMGLDIEKVPLLIEAKKIIDTKPYSLFLDKQQILLNDLMCHSINVKMPPGWLKYSNKLNIK